MGKIINQIFSWNEEDLRQEFCLESEYSDLALIVSQIKDKFHTIEEMMDRQLKVHKRWDGYGKKPKKTKKRT